MANGRDSYMSLPAKQAVHQFINAGSDLVAHDDLKDLAIWQSEEPQIGLSEIEGKRSWLIVPLISTSCV